MPLAGGPASARRATPRASTPVPDEFLTSSWYVVAYDEEVGADPLARTVLGQRLVLFRSPAGSVVALNDRCGHRGFPLSRGVASDGKIRCAYHGFAYAHDGTCVGVPGQTAIPASASIGAHPVVRRGPLLWVWVGAPDAADEAHIPAHAWMDEPGWHTVKGMATIAARYALVVENLLDLSHESFVHETSIGSSEVAQTPCTFAQAGALLHMSRHMSGASVPPTFRRATGIRDGTIDRRQDAIFHLPALYTLDIRVAPSGAAEHAGFRSKIVFAITPETKRTTHDFWMVANRVGDGPRFTGGVQPGILRTETNRVLMEDVAALERLEAALSANGPGTEVSINIDRGALLWRRFHRQQLEGGQAR